jgi:hypothetical protein
MMAKPINSELADTPSLFLEIVGHFELRPYEVSLIRDLVHQLPPETTPHDSLYYC